MIHLFQSILGFARSRTVTSDPPPGLNSSSPKKASSVGSKDRPSSKKEEAFQMDEVNTVKRTPRGSLKQNAQLQYSCLEVSDIGSQDGENSDLLANIPSDCYQKEVIKEVQLKEEDRLYSVRSRILKAPVMTPLRRQIKIEPQCPFCSRTITREDRSRLACSHRFHQACAQKMVERNQYLCNICEIKKKVYSINQVKHKRRFQN